LSYTEKEKAVLAFGLIAAATAAKSFFSRKRA
jgi:hypothetical protein